ncbi:Laminin subunit gamma-1, partial [Orchesella cincta]
MVEMQKSTAACNELKELSKTVSALLDELKGEHQRDNDRLVELAYQVEIMVVELQLKVILELRDSALMESVDKLYYDLYSLISNKYGVVQTHYENFNAKLELLNPIGKHDSKLSAEVDEAFQSFTKAWDAVKGELNTDLQECRERFEKLLDQVQLQLNDAGGKEEVDV